ncbi:unnamed protein product [Moneuplotes crassus]|uniref:Uncharacterized protein n=1 Tax=Euplotes crassus TaxID=5936 RepID=A0AAD1XAE6_EUPCR|nr:unnamed protein product [Moneuplotes crassus]
METTNSNRDFKLKSKAADKILAKLKSKGLKLKLNQKSKLLKVKRRRKLHSPTPNSKTFFAMRKKAFGIYKSSLPSKIMTALKRNRKKHPKTPRSPVPSLKLKVFCPPVDEELEQEKKRYLSIVQKAQNAMSSRQGEFRSPRILRNFLSTREFFKSQDNDSERSEAAKSDAQSSLSDINQLSDSRVQKNFIFRGKLSPFEARRGT